MRQKLGLIFANFLATMIILQLSMALYSFSLDVLIRRFIDWVKYLSMFAYFDACATTGC
jgi:hypothetical protein